MDDVEVGSLWMMLGLVTMDDAGMGSPWMTLGLVTMDDVGVRRGTSWDDDMTWLFVFSAVSLDVDIFRTGSVTRGVKGKVTCAPSSNLHVIFCTMSHHLPSFCRILGLGDAVGRAPSCW